MITAFPCLLIGHHTHVGNALDLAAFWLAAGGGNRQLVILAGGFKRLLAGYRRTS